MAIRTSWSLNVDEAVVVDRIKEELGKNYEVFFPANSQLKDIDLVVFNLKNGNAKTVQVKGSRSYTTKKGEEYSWIRVKKKSIFKTMNKTDFFIFVWYPLNLDPKTRKRTIDQAYIVIPLKKLQEKCKKWYKPDKSETYRFEFLADLKDCWCEDYPSGHTVDYSKYLNNFNLLKS